MEVLWSSIKCIVRRDLVMRLTHPLATSDIIVLLSFNVSSHHPTILTSRRTLTILEH